MNKNMVTIGNFDGVHLGHQHVFQKMCKELKPNQSVVLITFAPNPKAFFAPNAFKEITPLREKLRLIHQYFTERAVHVSVKVLRFHKSFALMSAEKFCQKLEEEFNPEKIFVGENFRFGTKRLGDGKFMAQYFEPRGISVEAVPTLLHQGNVISSSSIREALAQGDLKAVQESRGSTLCLTGRVHRGRQLGRVIGCSTANVRCAYPLALQGVVIAKVLWNNQWYPAVVNLGTRPTIEESKKQFLAEAHVLDFNQDLYGQLVRIEFLEKIRDERKMSGLEELKHQIQLDIKQARAYFKI